MSGEPISPGTETNKTPALTNTDKLAGGSPGCLVVDSDSDDDHDEDGGLDDLDEVTESNGQCVDLM